MRSRSLVLAAIAAFAAIPIVKAQDMMGLDVTSDAFTKAELSRSDIEAGASLPFRRVKIFISAARA